MPARSGDQRALTSEETRRTLRETGLAQFRLQLFRRDPHGLPTLVARFENATYQHFERPAEWVLELCGGGRYLIEASSLWDSRFEPDLIRPIGSRLPLELNAPAHDVLISAPLRPKWPGPTEMVFPERGSMVESVPGRRVPVLRDPLRHLTMGYSPPAPLMIDGKYAAPPGTGYFDMMYLFGEASTKDYFPTHDFAFGQDQKMRNDMPGIHVRVNGRSGGHFSLEVVKACSQGHVDASLLTRQSEVIKAIGNDELMADAMVQLYMALDRLKKMPLVGYALNPVIAFTREDDIKIEGAPPGMRLYLTGVCEAE